MRFFIVAILLLVSGYLSACQLTPEPNTSLELVQETLDGPGISSGQLPHLAVDPAGRFYLSWVEPDEAGGHRLRYAMLDGTSWTEPATVARGQDWFVNWADFPSLVVDGEGRKTAHFLQRNGGEVAYAYDVRLTRSSEDGWMEPISAHDDGTPTEHGFVSLLPWDDGETFVTWLDGRNTDPTAAQHHGAMTLRAGWLQPDGTMRAEAELDDRTCDCCQTAAVRIGEDVLVAYRDRSEAEVRDIAVTRWHDGAWTPPVRVHEDNWTIAGCPVNGPALAAAGETVAIAWFTAAGGTPRVLAAFSEDGGASFGDPVQIDQGRPLGRVDAVMLADGTAVFSWLELVDDGAEVRVRGLRPGAEYDGDPYQSVAASSAARSSGFPRMAAAGDTVVIAWTDVSDEQAEIRMARLVPSSD